MTQLQLQELQLLRKLLAEAISRMRNDSGDLGDDPMAPFAFDADWEAWALDVDAVLAGKEPPAHRRYCRQPAEFAFTRATERQKAAAFEWLRSYAVAPASQVAPGEWFHAAVLMEELRRLNEPAPVDMLLFCPKCGNMHVDAPKGDWTNPPHRSHECQQCKHTWRPADVPTNGVAFLKTGGKRDGTPVPAITPVASICEIDGCCKLHEQQDWMARR